MPSPVNQVPKLLPDAHLRATYTVYPDGQVNRRFAVISQDPAGGRGRVTLYHWDSGWTNREPGWYDAIPVRQRAFLAQVVPLGTESLWTIAPRLVHRLLTDSAGAALSDRGVVIALTADVCHKPLMSDWGLVSEASLAIMTSGPEPHCDLASLSVVGSSGHLELDPSGADPLVLDLTDPLWPAARRLAASMLADEPVATMLLTDLATYDR